MFQKIKNWIIKNTFEKIYRFYSYPFFNCDEEINKMEQADKDQYFYDLEFLSKSKGLQMEIKQLKQDIYRELSTKTNSDEGIAGYRLCLIFIDRFERRLFIQKQVKELDNSLKSINKI